MFGFGVVDVAVWCMGMLVTVNAKKEHGKTHGNKHPNGKWGL
jgi:hypothetical protein